MKYGIFVGRVCPLHLGHQKIIQKMIDDCGVDNCLMFIGSSNASLSWRVLFPYMRRRNWVKRIFKQLKVIGIPDCVNNDTEWFMMLDDYITSVFPEARKEDIIFYGGKQEDVIFFYSHENRNVEIVNRYELPISATQVREMLLLNLDISTVVDPRIAKEVKEVFHKQLKKLDQLRSE